MPTFKVKLARTIVEHCELTITAPNEREAIEKGLDDAKGWTIVEHRADVRNCEEILGLPE